MEPTEAGYLAEIEINLFLGRSCERDINLLAQK